MINKNAPQQENWILAPDSRGWHRVVYSDWGPADGPIVVCVHYLTGNGRYFDALAQDLVARGFRVIAPDMPGRGRSDFLKNPDDYNMQQYIGDLAVLLGALGVTKARSIDWVGASMGGFIGLIMAAMADSPLKRLALIDVGPVVAGQVLQGISAAIAAPPRFETLGALENYMREMRGPAWGPVPDDYWPGFAEHQARALPDGGLTLAYDPAINIAFGKNAEAGVDLWALWDAVTIPVLALRGGNSTLFTADIQSEMSRRGPGARGLLRHITLPGCGHVPSLAIPEQTSMIGDWLHS